jgi:precorrin-3B synthase
MTALAISRRGICPSLSAPMQTGDGLLVRLQPVSQGLTARQLIGLCDSAERHGNGLIEVTGRGNLQIRGLTALSVDLLAADVNRLDIVVKTGVPVEIPPLAGLDPDEIADPRPLAEAIRSAIADAGLSRRLGPKVSVVVDGGGRFGLAAVAADVRLHAFARKGRPLWRLALAGDARMASPLGATSFEGAVGFVMDLLSDIAARGPQARGRDLLPNADDVKRIEPGRLDPRPEQTPPIQGRSQHIDLGQPIPLDDGRIALAVALPFGSARAKTIAEWTRTVEGLGVDELRLAPGRMIIAICNVGATVGAIREKARALGLVTEPGDPRLHISACAGKPACASGHIETRRLASEIGAQQSGLIAHAGHIHISGCAKGCAHPAPAAITLVGDENGVGLVVNGTARQKPLAYTQADRLIPSLQRLAREVCASGEGGGNWLSPLGEERVAAAFRQDV